MEFALDHTIIATATYVTAAIIWLGVWHAAGGYRLQRTTRMLWFPFVLALVFLLANAFIVQVFDQVGTATYEEGRFVYITDRATIAVQALAAILVVATIVYGLTIRRLPVEFIRFMAYSVVAMLGFMAPLLWIPDGAATGFFALRHFQSAALIIGLFLLVAAVVLMLRDLVEHGGAEVALLSPDGVPLSDDERDEVATRREATTDDEVAGTDGEAEGTHGTTGGEGYGAQEGVRS